MLYEEWRKEIILKGKHVKGYPHFDRALNLKKSNRGNIHQDFRSVVNEIENLNTHEFLPIITFEKKIRKYIKTRDIDNYTGHKKKVVSRKIKIRPLALVSHIDSHIYSYFNFILSKEYEKKLKKFNLEKDVVAYRKVSYRNKLGEERGKGNIQLSRDAYLYIREHLHEEPSIFVLDIKGFFDNLNHDILLKNMVDVFDEYPHTEDILRLHKSMTEYTEISLKNVKTVLGLKKTDDISKKLPLKPNFREGIRRMREFFKKNKTGKGIPQGTPMSGLLSNVYLLEFDKFCSKLAKNVNGFYMRYSDDIIFITSKDARESLSEIKEKVELLHLKIEQKKTKEYVFSKTNNTFNLQMRTGNSTFKKIDYITYLGIMFDGEKIVLGSASVSRYGARHKRKWKRKYKWQRKEGTKPKIKRKKEKKGKNSKEYVKKPKPSYYTRVLDEFGSYNFKIDTLVSQIRKINLIDPKTRKKMKKRFFRY